LRAHFSRCSRRVVVVLLWAVFLKNHASLHAQQEAESRNKLALIGARIYPAPDAKPILNGIVIVANGKIVRVGERDSRILPKGIRTIGCTGKTLVAGLWNTHVHFIESKWNHAESLPAGQLTAQLQEMLTGYGFTSVVDTGSPLQNTLALRRRITSGEVQGPRILTAGMILFPEDGLPYYATDSCRLTWSKNSRKARWPHRLMLYKL
jgi:imidazolonepropionase-like amidohydrolase